jgi:hypothetical protein
MKAIPAILTLSGLALVGACYNPDYRADKEYCIGYCKTIDKCFERLDQKMCVRDCLKESWLQDVEDEQLQDLNDCLELQSCDSFLIGYGFGVCLVSTVGGRPSSDRECRRICQLHQHQSDECGNNFDFATCLDGCTWSIDTSDDTMTVTIDGTPGQCARDLQCEAYAECMNPLFPEDD